MDPSHHRGPQPSTSHAIPGAPDFPGPHPHIGFIEPQFVFPAPFLAEIVKAIREESSGQTRFIRDQYSSVVRGYAEMNASFDMHVRQTDRIFAEEHAQFQQGLESIRKEMRQFYENQTAAITDLGVRLNTLEGLSEASRDTLSSKIATVIETMEHGFDGMVAMIKTNEYPPRDPLPFESGIPAYNVPPQAFSTALKLPEDQSRAGDVGYKFWINSTAVKEALIPATWSQTDSEVDLSATRPITNLPLPESERPQGEQPGELPPVTVLSNPGSPSTSSGDNPEVEQDQLYDTPAASTPATEEPLVPPPTDSDDVDTVRAPESPPTTPPWATPATNCDALPDPPLQNPLFDATSPLTSINSPCSQDQDEPQVLTASSEHTISSPLPMSSNTTTRKRKRTVPGGNTVKRSRKNRKSRLQEDQVTIPYSREHSEGSYADPSIWPPVTADSVGSQTFIECERCEKFFHFGCVGLQGDYKNESPWECPLCIQDPARNATTIPREGGEMCSRPGCAVFNNEGGFYFMDRLMGRCYNPDQNVVKYLVAYEGYLLDQCTWEPPDSFSNDHNKINEFLEQWTKENPGVDLESLDPHETIFLKPAFAFACAGVNWPGAQPALSHLSPNESYSTALLTTLLLCNSD